MNDESLGYLKYLSNFCELDRPKMPNFNLSAYSDIEYLSVIDEVMKDYENVDDLNVTITHLKGK